jgi:hypothetical protein
MRKLIAAAAVTAALAGCGGQQHRTANNGRPTTSQTAAAIVDQNLQLGQSRHLTRPGGDDWTVTAYRYRQPIPPQGEFSPLRRGNEYGGADVKLCVNASSDASMGVTWDRWTLDTYGPPEGTPVSWKVA